MRGIFQGLFHKSSFVKKQEEILLRLENASKAREWQRAIKILQEFLLLDPKNISALVQLGNYLMEVGELQEAYAKFQLAHRLDDSSMVVNVNYARCLLDAKQTQPALECLTRAKVVIPDYPYINSIYSTLQFQLGDPVAARHFSLQAWLAMFENGRSPDLYLWQSAYVDQSEATLAAEHHFWAHTLPPLSEGIRKILGDRDVSVTRQSSEKIRIGYWSPDFRDHSVRYFFRPLLDGHDRERVEIFLYHDISTVDMQTDEMKKQADHFFKVDKNTDEELVELMVSHKLDVLVELAGHTSNNRLWLLQGRIATVQITGLGYPPTTGLSSMDAKLLDPFISVPLNERFYSEQAAILPQSFWCFDPRTDEYQPVAPPVIKVGNITFGCVGNIAKINNKVLGCWAEILRRVPRSRLLLRSVSFSDAMAVEAFSSKLAMAGIPKSRVELVGPVVGAGFFGTYDDIDIILDTHPFNGGTTTCFAVYMGVPVISMKGDSLISRMGASVLSNVGHPELVVDSLDQYVRKAISLSQDIEFLKKFRLNARKAMAQGSLGDGRKFAFEFENLCLHLLNRKAAGEIEATSQIEVLPPEELTRRASIVLNYGQIHAAKRIIKYCLENYPNFAGAHILLTDEMTRNGEFVDAVNYLTDRMGIFSINDRPAAYINIIRFQILAGQLDQARGTLTALLSCCIDDPLEREQALLYEALLENENVGAVPKCPEIIPTTGRSILCVIPCDDLNLFALRAAQLTEIAREGYQGHVSIERCSEAGRLAGYEAALQNTKADIVVLLQKNLSVHHQDFFFKIALALDSQDVLGFSGATRWKRLDWRLEDYAERATAFVSTSQEKTDCFEIYFAGQGRNLLVDGMAILEGGMLAVNAKKVCSIPFDSTLLNAGSLLEEYWSYRAGMAGLKLAVHRGLGIYVDCDIPIDGKDLMDARVAIVRRMNFDVFSVERSDGYLITAPCQAMDQAFKGIDRFLM